MHTNFTPASTPSPSPELVRAIADVILFIDRRQRERHAVAALTDDIPRLEYPPTPPVKERRSQ